MFSMLAMLWRYRSVISMAVGAYKAFKSVRQGEAPAKPDLVVADYLREVHETKELIEALPNVKTRSRLRSEFYAVRRQAKKVGSLEGFDRLQERLKALLAEVKQA